MGGMVLGPANALTGWANTQIKKFETLTSTVGAYHQKLVTALGGKAPDTTAADAAAAKKSEAAEKARKALEEESRPENVRARKAKALAAAELEKPAEEDALRKARGDAYKEKAEADRAALRGRVAESVPLGGRFGTKGLSSAIKGEKPEAVKAITEAFHAEAEATISGAERLKSILKEKLGTVTGLASSATGGALSLANAVAGRFGSGKDVTQSRDAAQAEIDQRAKDAKEERRRNFVPQTFSSAREMDRAVTAMVSGADKKEKVSEEQLREIKKNSDAQVTHLKVMADNLTSIAKSGLVGILK
jgi:hypothetical protein